jgi:hypothetical protein
VDTANIDKQGTLVKDVALGKLLVGTLDSAALPAGPVGAIKLYVDSRAFKDLWIAVAWGG